MPRISLYEWGGSRHGTIAKRGQKFEGTATSLEIKESLVSYFSTKAVFHVDAKKDILLSITKPENGSVTMDEFSELAATLDSVRGDKKAKKLYFSLTPECIAKNVKPDTKEEEEESEEESEENDGTSGGETKRNAHTTTPTPTPAAPMAPAASAPAPAPAPAMSAPAPAPAPAMSASAAHASDQEPPADWRARQEYEKNKYTYIREHSDELSSQFKYRHRVKRVHVDPKVVLFDETGWSFDGHPNERRFGWLFGTRNLKTNEIKIDAMYEPPQFGLTKNIMLRPDIEFDTIRQMAQALRMDIVGCIRTRPFRYGPYGPDTEFIPTSSEAMFMAAMQAKFDDGKSKELWSLESGESRESEKSEESEKSKQPNTRGMSFVSLVYEPKTKDNPTSGSLLATQVTSQMVDLYQQNELTLIKGEEYKLETKERVFSKLPDPKFPNATQLTWEFKKQNMFSTMFVHLPLAIVEHKSWLPGSPKMRWIHENRGDVATKRAFKSRLRQFQTSMLAFFADFHLLIWLLFHHDEVGLSRIDVDEIVHACRDGDREICDSYRSKLEALMDIGFRDPYVANSRGILAAAPEKANILAEQMSAKHQGNYEAVICPIRSALATTSEERKKTYTNLANDYAQCTKDKMKEICEQYGLDIRYQKDRACIAIVGGLVRDSDPGMALARWQSLKDGTIDADTAASKRLREEEEAKQSQPEADFGFGGGALEGEGGGEGEGKSSREEGQQSGELEDPLEEEKGEEEQALTEDLQMMVAQGMMTLEQAHAMMG